MLKVVGMAVDTAVDTAVVTDTRHQHTRTPRRISLSMRSHRTAIVAESVSDLGAITALGTMAVTTGITAATVDTTADMADIMVETTAGITAAMAATTVGTADITVVMADITELIEINLLVLTGQARQVQLAKPSKQTEKARR